MNAYVRDIMTTGVATVRSDTSCRELAVMFREHRVSGFPVTADDGTVVGVVSESDLVALAAGRHHRGYRADREATAGDLMSRPAVTIGPDDLVRTAARMMQSHRV
jgi:CBS domain-containing protein